MRSITQTLKLLVCTVSALLLFLLTTPVYAAPSATPATTTTTGSTVICNDGKTEATLADCTQVCPSGKTIPQDQDCATTPGNCSDISACDLINKYINPFIDFLAAVVGVAVVISIVVGGIQYSSSAGDPSKTSAAKDRIRNALIALIVFIFLFALLNFLIPGGIG